MVSLSSVRVCLAHPPEGDWETTHQTMVAGTETSVDTPLQSGGHGRNGVVHTEGEFPGDVIPVVDGSSEEEEVGIH